MITLYDDRGNPERRDSDGHIIRTPEGEGRYHEQSTVDKAVKLLDYAHRAYDLFSKRQWTVREYLADRPWNDEEKRYFDNQQRDPDVANINLMRSQKKYLDGQMRANRVSFQVQPKDDDGGGLSSEVLEIANDLLSWASYRNRLVAKDSDVFLGGLDGMGVWHTFQDWIVRFSEGGVPRRELTTMVEVVNPFMIYFDPEAEDRFGSDCRWVIRKQYYRAEEIQRKWKRLTGHLQWTRAEQEKWWEELTQRVSDFEKSGISGLLRDPFNGLYLVLDLEERRISPYYYIIDIGTGKCVGNTMQEDNADVFNQMPQFNVVEIEQPCIHITRILPYKEVILDEYNEPFAHYSYTPFISNWSSLSIVDVSSFSNSMRGVQKTINLSNANLQEAIVRALRGAKYVKQGTATYDFMVKNKHRIGAIIPVDNYTELPVNADSEVDIKGLDYLLEFGIRMMGFIAGQGQQPHGRSEYAGESGRHAEIKRAETEQTQYPDIDDFYQAKALHGETLLEREQRIITPETLLNVYGFSGQLERSYFVAENASIIKNLRSFVRVNDGIYQTTYKRAQYAMFMDMMDMLLRYYPAEIVDPGEPVRRSELVGGDKLGDEITNRWLEIISAPQSGNGKGAVQRQTTLQ